EEGERDADAAEDEILPGGLERLVRAVDADHEHGGERGQLDGDPHQADVVGEQPQVHGEHQGLIHRVVEAQMRRGEPADLQLVADVAGAEGAGGEADEGAEHHEHDVEVVDEQVAGGGGPRTEQRQRCQEGRQRRQHVEAGGQPIAGQQRQQHGRARRNEQDGGHRLDRQDGGAQRRSPRKVSSASTSTESKRSRMRNRKTPITMKATSTEKATLISTTSGMPLAPVAARMRPFSSDMKPMIWLTALRRVTIIISPSSTTERANARSSRASGSAAAAAFSMMTMERATSPMPASMVGPMPTTVSMARWMPSWATMRRSARGMITALSTSASTAVT